jgi:LysR family transcriptional regulator, regulator of abg operon
MRLQQLEGLVALAEAGSMRAAARRLGISQPALTKSLKGLEQELGITLLQRTPRGVVLTEAGHAAQQRARGIAADTQRLRDEMAHLRGVGQGRVTVAVSPVPAVLLLPGVLARFFRQCPGVQVQVLEGLYPAVLPDLRNGSTDIALGPQPPQDLLGTGLLVEPMFSNELVVAARVGHPRAGTTRLADLLDADWLQHGPDTGPGSLFAPAFAGHGLVPPPVAVRSTSFTASIALLEQSDLLCVLPRRLIGHLQSRHQITALPLADAQPAWDNCLVMRADVPLTPAARELATLFRRMPMALS